MIVFSVAQATTHLGIDAKTLHCWLSQAHLPLLPHPEDARKKALSQEDLLLLAHLHQRHLPAFRQAEPSALLAEPDPEPLVALNARLDGLHAQIIALQQQVAELMSLLQAHPSAPATPPPPAQETRAPKRPPKPAKPKVPAKPTHVIPRVEYAGDGHYAVICPKKGSASF